MSRMLIWAGLLLVFCASIRADEIYFKNGDRLTGVILGMEKQQVRIATENIGEVSADLGKIERFSTAKAITVILADGTVQRLRVVLYKDGLFHLGPDVSPATARTDATTRPATAEAPVPATTQIASRPTTLPLPAGATRTVRIGELTRIGPTHAPWKGNVTVGAAADTGNTNAVTISAGYEVKRRGDHDRIDTSGAYNYGRQEDNDTGEQFVSVDNWHVAGQYSYFLTQKWYTYAGGRLDHDALNNLYLRATPGGGAGYQWVETDRSNINTEVGLNWIYEQYDDPQETNEYAALRLAWHVDQKLTNTVRLVHNFEILPKITDVSDVVINADLGLRVRVTGHVFTELKAVLAYDSTPAEGKQDTDMQYKALLGYEF